MEGDKKDDPVTKTAEYEAVLLLFEMIFEAGFYPSRLDLYSEADDAICAMKKAICSDCVISWVLAKKAASSALERLEFEIREWELLLDEDFTQR